MTEISESIYFKADDRRAGVQWLEANELSGYVLPARGQWVQVFPDWAHLAQNGQSAKALQNSSGLLVYYYYADERLWSLCIHRDGEAWFQYECIWMVDDFVAQGAEIEDVANVLDVSPPKLNSLLYTGPAGISWQSAADNAAELADLLSLPNYAYASFNYTEQDAATTDTHKYFVSPDTGYDVDVDESTADSDSSNHNATPTPEPARRDDDAPWKAVYELARGFLQNLYDEELIELTLDSQLARDRLVERLTKTIIENPVSRDSQVIHHWLDNLMTAPEIVDIFATDDMLADAYHRAKDDIQQADQ